MEEFLRDPAFWAIVAPWLIYAIVGALSFGIAGAFMLARADRELTGFLLGLFLGPIGLVIAWVIRDNALREEEAERARRLREPDPAQRLLSRRVTGQPLGSQPANPHADVDVLERLAKLHRDGDLTDEEFAAKKRQILGGTPPHEVQQGRGVPPPRRFR